jgi:hypothetical protein
MGSSLFPWVIMTGGDIGTCTFPAQWWRSAAHKLKDEQALTVR